jgi:HSF-type DNA-binding
MERPVTEAEHLKMMERVTEENDIATNSDRDEPLTESAAAETRTKGSESIHPDSLKLNTGLLPFPDSLMSLLDSDKVADVIRWLPDGDAFCLEPAQFAELVLDKYFQGTKFESFTRKLNRWYVYSSAAYSSPYQCYIMNRFDLHFIRNIFAGVSNELRGRKCLQTQSHIIIKTSFEGRPIG